MTRPAQCWPNNSGPTDCFPPYIQIAANPVGASLLAMVVNDNAGNLTPSGVIEIIASRLAPTSFA
ncbi:hypothetical protein CES87_20885 [Pseudomonas sp. ERMR1:02]|nr:hypothetical protein CES87_20885 [Pseudomonas sp. ERMR1:02]